MANFQAVITLSKNDPDADALLARIEQGASHDREFALAELQSRANRSGDPDDWNAVGVGFHLAGEILQASTIFTALVEQFPEVDAYRMNLATVCSLLAQVDLCIYHLRHLAEHGSNEKYRQAGRAQLEGYERSLGLSSEDRTLRELQLRCLRQRVNGPFALAADFRNLGRLLFLEGQVTGNQQLLAEATVLLERGTATYPKEVALLEHLVLCYLRHDPDGRREAALKCLERLDPHSEMLAIIKGLDDRQFNKHVDDMRHMTKALLKAVCEGKGEQRRAALADLARISEAFPSNSSYRLMYAFALMAESEMEKAREQAEHIARHEEPSHSFHFNLGQIFWISGDTERGRHHLELALRYAETDQDREDVHERITELGSQQRNSPGYRPEVSRG